jgi:hypothetical protein
VIGAMTHNPQMVGAGLKALAHNELAAACRQGIAEALEDRGRQREERGRIQGPSQRGERGRSREPWQRGSAGRPSRAGRRSAARRPDTSMGDRARPEDRDRGRRADGTSSGRPSAARPPPERRDRRSPTSWGSEGRDPGVQSQRRGRDDDDGRENRGGGRGR